MQPGDRYFSLEFLSTDYRSPKDNYYSFYLEGYETTWISPGATTTWSATKIYAPGPTPCICAAP